MRRYLYPAVIAATALLACGAQATEFVSNGGFETHGATPPGVTNTQFGAGFGGQVVTDWTGLGGNNLQFYYDAATATSVNAVNQFGDPGGYLYPSFSGASPDGGHFVALDGDSDYYGQISQSIGNLTVGQVYTLSFYWGASQLINRSGPTTESLHVTFGGQTFDTETLANASGAFSGWKQVSTNFTATATTQALTFMSVGTPNGLPPIALLDGVSLTGGVPEPTVWTMMIMGFGGIGVMIRRRRGALAA
jgi:hypothetical protein